MAQDVHTIYATNAQPGRLYDEQDVAVLSDNNVSLDVISSQ